MFAACFCLTHAVEWTCFLELRRDQLRLGFDRLKKAGLLVATTVGNVRAGILFGIRVEIQVVVLKLQPSQPARS